MIGFINRFFKKGIDKDLPKANLVSAFDDRCEHYLKHIRDEVGILNTLNRDVGKFGSNNAKVLNELRLDNIKKLMYLQMNLDDLLFKINKRKSDNEKEC